MERIWEEIGHGLFDDPVLHSPGSVEKIYETP
jgi:hypothetical protein